MVSINQPSKIFQPWHTGWWQWSNRQVTCRYSQLFFSLLAAARCCWSEQTAMQSSWIFTR